MAGGKRLNRSVGLLGFAIFFAEGRADDPPPPVWPGRFHATMSQSRDGDLGIVDLWYDYAAGHNLNVIQTQSGEEDGPLFDNERSNGTTYYYLPAKAKAKYCQVIDFGVGIIKPDWLAGATYLGEETSGIYDCYKWEQGEIPEAHQRFLGYRPEAAVTTEATLVEQQQVTHLSLLGQQKSQTGGSDAGSNLPLLRGKEGREGGEGRFITYWSEKGSDRPVRWTFFDGAEFEVIRFDPGATMVQDLFQIPDYCFSDEAVES